MTQTDVYELFAVRYATHKRKASENFIGGDPHDYPMPMDYFVWVATNNERTFVIDTGFNVARAAKRGREFLRCPVRTLSELGVDATRQVDVILTHLHYDHAGNCDLFPNARFHLQEHEIAFATGRYMKYDFTSAAYEVDNVVGVVRAVFARRVEFYSGDAEIAPGISVHLIGGHTMGLQAVRVRTRRGWVVVASDATHFFANLQQRRPFPIVLDVGKMLEGYQKLEQLADSVDHIIPGHDPLVMELYPPAEERLRGMVVRLDAAPVK